MGYGLDHNVNKDALNGGYSLNTPMKISQATKDLVLNDSLVNPRHSKEAYTDNIDATPDKNGNMNTAIYKTTQ
jgi:hypothetical protein